VSAVALPTIDWEHEAKLQAALEDSSLQSAIYNAVIYASWLEDESDPSDSRVKHAQQQLPKLIAEIFGSAFIPIATQEHLRNRLLSVPTEIGEERWNDLHDATFGYKPKQTTALASKTLAPADRVSAPQAPKPTNLQKLNKLKASPQWKELGDLQYGDAQELVATWVLLRGAMMCDKKDELVKHYQRTHGGKGSRASIKRWLRSAVETGVLTKEERPRSGGKWSTTIYRINPEILNRDPS